jgi:hypothetical protein
VRDRSFLTELLALMLAAALGWPGSGNGFPPKPPVTTGVRCHSTTIRAGTRAVSGQIKPIAEHDASTPRGVLDDDPAILADNSEEWIQGSTGCGLPAVGEFASRLICAKRRMAGAIADPALSQPALIDRLCRYQC